MTKGLDEMRFYDLFIKFSNLISSDMIMVSGACTTGAKFVAHANSWQIKPKIKMPSFSRNVGWQQKQTSRGVGASLLFCMEDIQDEQVIDLRGEVSE